MHHTGDDLPVPRYLMAGILWFFVLMVRTQMMCVFAALAAGNATGRSATYICMAMAKA